MSIFQFYKIGVISADSVKQYLLCISCLMIVQTDMDKIQHAL